MSRPRVQTVRRAMLPEEVDLARALGTVRMQPASFDKRFGLGIAARATTDAPMISESEAQALQRIAWRYRRQMTRATRALLARLLPDGAPAAPWAAAAAAPHVSLETHLEHVAPPVAWGWPRADRGGQLAFG